MNKTLATACAGAALAVSVAACSSASSSAASNSGSSAPAVSTGTTGSVGTTFKVTNTDDGGVYDVTLDKVLDPANGYASAGTGEHWVGLVFTIKDVAAVSDGVGLEAVLAEANNNIINSNDDPPKGYTAFQNDDGSFSLSPGQTITGAIEYGVPNSVKLISVQWGGMHASAVTWSL